VLLRTHSSNMASLQPPSLSHCHPNMSDVDVLAEGPAVLSPSHPENSRGSEHAIVIKNVEFAIDPKRVARHPGDIHRVNRLATALKALVHSLNLPDPENPPLRPDGSDSRVAQHRFALFPPTSTTQTPRIHHHYHHCRSINSTAST
jgi:hypothetical protein